MAETVKYRKSDRLALREVVKKFAKTVFDKYQVKRSDVRTVPALAMKVFRTSYRREDMEIPYIKGMVDKDIRNGYYGGIVAALRPEVKSGYYYDVNSAYPAAMIKDLPVGNPTRKTVTSRQGVFGYVHANVTAPATTVNNVRPLPMRVVKDGVEEVVFQHGITSQG